MWIKSGIITGGSSDKVLNGKDYKAGMCLHKITLQAALRVLLPQMMDFFEQSHPDIYKDIGRCEKGVRYPSLDFRSVDFFCFLKTSILEVGMVEPLKMR